MGPSPAAPYLCCVALDRCPMVPFHISFPGSMCFNGWISWEKSFLRSLEDLDDDMNADVPRKVASSASVVSEASVAATWQRWGPCRNESSHDMDPLAFHVLVRKNNIMTCNVHILYIYMYIDYVYIYTYYMGRYILYIVSLCLRGGWTSMPPGR